MDITQWIDATSPKKKGLTEAQKAKRAEERKRVMALAGTTINYLTVARCRGKYGNKIIYRMAAATKEEKNRVLVRHCIKEPE